MDEALKQKAIAILDGLRTMTIATIRPDGWPQATTVGYANEGLTLYFLCGLPSQKAANLARDSRVSVTVGADAPVMQITGLSMAARAERVTDPVEGARIIALLLGRYAPEEAPTGFAMPSPSDVALFKVTPTVISVLDYSKGFGHADLIDLASEARAAA
jgi:nitroimidazol reductase NimA-like FMN-containing flavoprotein (pyridoxamine 5'-phosphate oxidase superfamily)